MKRYLITAVVIFIGLLAVATTVLCNTAEKPTEVDFGSYAVAANEIEQLIADGDTETAQIRAAELKTALSDYSAKSNSNTAYLWWVFGISSSLIIVVFLYVWFAILRPFEKLTGFAERIANGDLTCRLIMSVPTISVSSLGHLIVCAVRFRMLVPAKRKRLKTTRRLSLHFHTTSKLPLRQSVHTLNGLKQVWTLHLKSVRNICLL